MSIPLLTLMIFTPLAGAALLWYVSTSLLSIEIGFRESQRN